MHVDQFLLEMDALHQGFIKSRIRLQTVTERLNCTDKGKLLARYVEQARKIFRKRINDCTKY